MKVHSARRINANLPVKLTPNSTHHQKRSPTQRPKPTGTCGWNGTDDADDADGANAVGGLQKQYKFYMSVWETDPGTEKRILNSFNRPVQRVLCS